jgi:hypothetical protein
MPVTMCWTLWCEEEVSTHYWIHRVTEAWEEHCLTSSAGALGLIHLLVNSSLWLLPLLPLPGNRCILATVQSWNFVQVSARLKLGRHVWLPKTSWGSELHIQADCSDSHFLFGLRWTGSCTSVFQLFKRQKFWPLPSCLKDQEIRSLFQNKLTVKCLWKWGITCQLWWKQS